MPEISLSEEQHERLEQVRQDVESAYVEDYGYIPIEDAIEYLLDTYTPPERRGAGDEFERLATAEYPQLQAVASNVPEVPGSGIDADEMRGRLLAELGVEAFAAELAAVADTDTRTQTASREPGSGDDSGTVSGPASETGTSPDAAGVGNENSTGEAGNDGGSTGGRPTSGSSASDGTGPGETSSGGGSMDGPGGSDPLAAVNRILSEHDDKWREGGGDEPYEVDLPDGRTESVRTKDDVRQLLFRHY
jgi:hypothetical protein